MGNLLCHKYIKNKVYFCLFDGSTNYVLTIREICLRLVLYVECVNGEKSFTLPIILVFTKHAYVY